MSNYVHKSEYFYGNKVSQYGLDNGYIDYRTLSKCFDAILNNDIMGKTQDCGYGWELVNGVDYDEETDYYYDIYQCYIIDEAGYRILSELTDEIVYYNDFLDMYVWGITHFGTSWDYVLTDIKIDLQK